MGFRSRITTMIVQVIIMALAWELSEMGTIRNLTSNFGGKIIVSLAIILIANLVGGFLSGGK